MTQSVTQSVAQGVAQGVTVVGLGPGGTDWLLPAARAALAAVPEGQRFARTERHPAIEQLAAESMRFRSFDHVYDASENLEVVYATIVDELVAAARSAPVVYAVPGSPVVAERTVELLAARSDIQIEIVPGLSFAELAWSRLRIDPLDSTRIVDGRTAHIGAAELTGRILFAQCDSRLVLSDLKLTLLEHLEPDHPAVALQRLGRPDEEVTTVALADLDRVVDADHLTSVFVDTGRTESASEFARLVALAERLRGPGGCPWDAKQTHHSLARHTLEEAYEVLEAIQGLPESAPSGEFDLARYDSLEDELGDLLFQVCIHSVLAAETGAFTVADVATRIHAKLVHRHPHVFGDVSVDNADDVVRNWEQIKQAEKSDASLMDGITSTLPALLYVPKVFRKAASLDVAPLADLVTVRAALERLAAADETAEDDPATAFAELLAATVAAVSARGLDAEGLLRAWAERYIGAFRAIEPTLISGGVSGEMATLSEMSDAERDTVRQSLWAAASGAAE